MSLTSNIAGRLHAAIAAVCPITGVRVIARGNPGHAEIVFDPQATQPQKDAAAAALAAFDWSDAAQIAWESTQQPERSALVQAAAQAVSDIDTYLAIASPTNAQVAAQVRRLSQNMRAVIRRLAQLE